MSTPLPTLFLAEGALNILSGLYFILSPSTLLSLSVPPLPTTSLAPLPYSSSSLQLVQYLGSLAVCLGVPLILGAQSNAAAIASRRIVYWTLFSGEVGLVGCFLLQLLGGGAGGGAGHGGAGPGLTGNALAVGTVGLGMFGAARLWILTQKGEWFADGAELGKKRS